VREYRTDDTSPGYQEPADSPEIPLPGNLPKRLEFTLHETGDGSSVLLLNGAIEDGDAQRFDAFLASLDAAPDMVALNSPGGRVGEAIRIGHGIRERELDTVMPPGMVCYSACPYILSGGINRVVSDKASVGLHQHYYDQPGYMPVFFAVEDIQRGQGRTMEYLIEMGIDPSVMVHSLNTPPDEIYILVEEELIESRIATKMSS
jgi:hypothetical protein